MPKLATALLATVLLAASAAAAAPPTVYVSPDAPRPRFGGEFRLTDVGPVAGYWRSECYSWHVRSQARRTGPRAAPALDAAFKRFVSGLIADRPAYEDMSPAMAEAVRKNLRTDWPSINRMGRATVARKFDTTRDGDELYVLDQTGGTSHWNLIVNPEGKIATAFMCQGQGL
jgi:hypothetical protein